MLLKTFKDCYVGDYVKTPIFPIKSYKNVSLRYAFENSSPSIQEVIAAAPLKQQHKYITVDIKVHYLKKGQSPALPYWHVDGVRDPSNPIREELNHLIIFGEGCETRFLNEERVYVEENIHKVLDGCRFITIPTNRYISYGRVPHQAASASKDTTRLLIKITESDHIKPINKEFEVTYA